MFRKLSLFTGMLTALAILQAWCPPASADLLAHWTFDESSGTSVADKTGAYPGTLSATGSAFVPGGISGNALFLNRLSNGFATFGNVFGFTNGNFSVVAWIKTTPGDTTDNMLIAGKQTAGFNNGYFLNVNTSSAVPLGQLNKAMFYAGEQFVTPVSTTTVNDGAWHQVVAVYSAGGNYGIYVDGTPVEATRPSVPIPANTASFLIGGVTFGSTPTGLFTGFIDEVQIYDHALSDVEIDYLFQNPARELAPRMAAHPAVELAWRSKLGVSYQIQWTSEVETNNWSNLGSPISGNGTTNYFFDTTRNGTRRFYRIQLAE